MNVQCGFFHDFGPYSRKTDGTIVLSIVRYSKDRNEFLSNLQKVSFGK